MIELVEKFESAGVDMKEWRAALEHIAAGKPDPLIVNGIGYRPELEDRNAPDCSCVDVYRSWAHGRSGDRRAD